MTLQSEHFVLPQSTQEALGFDALWRALENNCGCIYGRENLNESPFLGSVEAIEARMAEVWAAKVFLEKQNFTLISNLNEIRFFLEAALKDEVLSSADLKEISQSLVIMSRLKSALQAGGAGAQLLGVVATITEWHDFALDILRCFDEHGNLVSNASPELAAAKAQVFELQERMRHRLEKLIETLDEQGVLQEPYFTLRNERYVLPVRSGAMGKIDGIVHDTSQTGHTHFVEPAHHVALGNKIAVALGEVKVEENKILGELTARILARVDEIQRDINCVGRLDATMARGQLALDLDAQVPKVVAGPQKGALSLVDAKHPHLLMQSGALQREKIIANTIQFNEVRGLVVSGPNAGGKTVVLKMVGLLTAMVRAGLPIPAQPNSVVPLFDGVVAMVGDGQNLASALSTFSAEAHELKGLIDTVAGFHRNEQALVLLDELFSGTDAQEGGALARAALEHLVEMGATVLVTTHLEAVKRLALESESSDGLFKSLFMVYDPQSNTPTYQIREGGVGQSYAIQTAENMGLPRRLLERAMMLFHGISKSEEKGFKSLLEEKKKILKAFDRTKHQLKKSKQAQSELRDQLQAQEKVAAQWQGKHADLLDEELMKTQRLISKAVAALQSKANPKILNDMNHELKKAIEDRKTKPAKPQKTSDALKVGDTVWLKAHPGQTFVLEKIEKDELWLQGDVLKMRVKAHEVEKRSFGAKKNVQKDVKVNLASTESTNDMLDIRGLRVEDALSDVANFVDRCVVAGVRKAYIRHGQGTGALKNAVREWVRKSAYTPQVGPAPDTLGGDGTTLLDFSDAG